MLDIALLKFHHILLQQRKWIEQYCKIKKQMALSSTFVLVIFKGFLTLGFRHYFVSESGSICCHVFISDFWYRIVIKGNECSHLLRWTLLVSMSLKLCSRGRSPIWGFENYQLLPWFFIYIPEHTYFNLLLCLELIILLLDMVQNASMYKN